MFSMATKKMLLGKEKASECYRGFGRQDRCRDGGSHRLEWRPKVEGTVSLVNERGSKGLAKLGQRVLKKVDGRRCLSRGQRQNVLKSAG